LYKVHPETEIASRASSQSLAGFQTFKRIWTHHASRGMKMRQATGDQRNYLYFKLSFSGQGELLFLTARTVLTEIG